MKSTKQTHHVGTLLTFVGVGAGACAHSAPVDAPKPAAESRPALGREDLDRRAIRAAVRAITEGVDGRRWTQVQAAFAERVVLDYGVPELLLPEEIVARWKPLLSAFDRTHHRLGEEQVSFLPPDRARIEAPFEAEHELRGAEGGAKWTLTGRYELEAIRTPEGWKITRGERERQR
jgi:hypothetical protein